MIGSKFTGRRLYFNPTEGIYQETLPMAGHDDVIVQRVLTTPIQRTPLERFARWLKQQRITYLGF